MAGSATITAVDDSAAEDSETITIAASHGATRVGTRNITIAASDRPMFRLTVAPASTIAEGESAVLTVSIGDVTFAEEQTIELDLGGSATAGSDYTVTPSAITIVADHAVRHHHRRPRDGRQRHHHGGRRQCSGRQ
jgi:hypothetical protein